MDLMDVAEKRSETGQTQNPAVSLPCGANSLSKWKLRLEAEGNGGSHDRLETDKLCNPEHLPGCLRRTAVLRLRRHFVLS